MSYRNPSIGEPVYLYWSEDPASLATHIGWGGEDLYRCRACNGWQGDEDQAVHHSKLHAAARGEEKG